MRRSLVFLGRSLVFLVLTLLTQIGGIVYLSLFPFYRWIDHRLDQGLRSSQRHSKSPLPSSKTPRLVAKVSLILLKCSGFIVAYLTCTLLIVPLIARPLGRVPMPMTEQHHIKPLHVWTCLFNRNYVRPALRDLAFQTAAEMNRRYPGTTLNYLDCCPPFIDRFPLVPHLSHNDGKKMDLSFCYLDSGTGQPTNQAPSPLGYGICEEPRAGEKDQPCFCREQGYWQYNLLHTIVPQHYSQGFIFDSTRTKTLVALFAANPATGKLFIEPHLRTRLGLDGYDRIRYHGCHAVRHDDHIHVQLP